MCFEIVVSYLESRTMTVPLPTMVSRKDATRLWGFSDKVYFFHYDSFSCKLEEYVDYLQIHSNWYYIKKYI